jgi:hypothetical protein
VCVCVCVCVCVRERERERSRNLNHEAAQARAGLLCHRKKIYIYFSLFSPVCDVYLITVRSYRNAEGNNLIRKVAYSNLRVYSANTVINSNTPVKYFFPDVHQLIILITTNIQAGRTKARQKRVILKADPETRMEI